MKNVSYITSSSAFVTHGCRVKVRGERGGRFGLSATSRPHAERSSFSAAVRLLATAAVNASIEPAPRSA
jgi:hypothetical protein